MPTNNVEIRSLTTATWNDFASLMKTDSQCSDCWCLNHRAPAGCPTGTEAMNKMNSLVENKNAYGLLAYQNNVAVGWIAIDPMSLLIGHDCQETGKPDEWSIHCLFIKDGFRGQGISAQLIQSAIEYAKNNGAKLVSAFPIPSENRSKFPPNEAEFSGRHSTYEKLGFKTVDEASEFYQRVEFNFN